MKPKLNCLGGAASELTPESKRLFPALSPQNRTRQVGLRHSFGRSVRLPVLVQNRAYLKALREAELAIWNTPRIPRQVAMNLNPTSVRLPSPTRDDRESWLYALLAALCLLVLGHELWTTFQAAGNWSNFVEFVRRLLA